MDFVMSAYPYGSRYVIPKGQTDGINDLLVSLQRPFLTLSKQRDWKRMN
jgi:hypothetical protein